MPRVTQLVAALKCEAQQTQETTLAASHCSTVPMLRTTHKCYDHLGNKPVKVIINPMHRYIN